VKDCSCTFIKQMNEYFGVETSLTCGACSEVVLRDACNKFMNSRTVSKRQASHLANLWSQI